MYNQKKLLNGKEIGSLEGILNVSPQSDLISKYFLQDQNLNREQLDIILNNVDSDKISILVNVEVDDDFQEKGYGSELLKDFLSQVQGNCLLVCNIAEDHVFTWYEGYGFEIINFKHLENPTLPIMIRS